jgi:hypothetical protein
MFLLLILTGLVSQAQNTSLPEGVSQEKIISLMQKYSKMTCTLGEIKKEGYDKTIEIIPQDNSIIHDIIFISNVVKNLKDTTKIEVVIGKINGELLEFVIDVNDDYTVVTKQVHQYEKLEAYMTKLLKGTKPGTKKEK